MTPRRVQLKRTKGWRKPEGAVVVARPSKWGNPYKVVRDHTRMPEGSRYTYGASILGGGRFEWYADPARAAQRAVNLFRAVTLTSLDVEPLRGKDLACWCPLDQPCHADVLLEVANS